MNDGTFLDDYAALHQSAAFQMRPSAGVLALSDNDRADFLQRMTTNNISVLKPGQSAVTVLTSPTARIVFVFTVVCRVDELWLLPAFGQTSGLERHLRGQIFFMDKVKVRNLSMEQSRLRVMGPQAGQVLAALGLDLPEAQDNAWRENAGVLAVKQEGYDLPGYELIGPTDKLAEASATLQAAGCRLLQDETAYHTRRIELGRPAVGSELIGDYTPLETGLAWACAENKGCYTGQEILARQVTYDKVMKALVQLEGQSVLSPGADVKAGGQSVGVVTSAAYSPHSTSYRALAIIKRAHQQAGGDVMVGETEVHIL